MNLQLIKIDMKKICFIAISLFCSMVVSAQKFLSAKEMLKMMYREYAAACNAMSKVPGYKKIALCDGLLAANPMDRVTAEEKKPLGARSMARVYLTIEEVKAFQSVETTNGRDTKAAFMFSCFTGLRFSDIVTLKWWDIHKTDNGLEIVKKMVKTQNDVCVPISNVALRWMPKQGDAKDDDLVFNVPSFPWVEMC